MTPDEQVTKMTKAINQAIKVMSDRFGSTVAAVARSDPRPEGVDAEIAVVANYPGDEDAGSHNIGLSSTHPVCDINGLPRHPSASDGSRSLRAADALPTLLARFGCA